MPSLYPTPSPFYLDLELPTDLVPRIILPSTISRSSQPCSTESLPHTAVHSDLPDPREALLTHSIAPEVDF